MYTCFIIGTEQTNEVFKEKYSESLSDVNIIYLCQSVRPGRLKFDNISIIKKKRLDSLLVNYIYFTIVTFIEFLKKIGSIDVVSAQDDLKAFSFIVFRIIFCLRFKICIEMHGNAKDMLVLYHGNSLRIRILNRARLFFYKIAVKYSDKIRIVSAGQYAQIDEKFHHKVFKFPAFTQLPKCKRKSVNLNKPLKIAFVGSLIPLKNPSALVGAIVQLLESIRIELHVYGSGPLLLELKQAAKAYLDEYIFFHGYLPKVSLYDSLQNCDVFVQPSVTEGFSLALLEAMSLGLVPIVTDVGSSRELVKDCNGFITTGATVDLVSILLKINQCRTILDSYSKNCISTAEIYSKNNNWNKSYRQFISF